MSDDPIRWQAGEERPSSLLTAPVFLATAAVTSRVTCYDVTRRIDRRNDANKEAKCFLCQVRFIRNGNGRRAIKFAPFEGFLVAMWLP